MTVEHLRVLGAELDEDVAEAGLRAAANAAYVEFQERDVDVRGVAPVVNEEVRRRLQDPDAPLESEVRETLDYLRGMAEVAAFTERGQGINDGIETAIDAIEEVLPDDDE